MYSTFHLVIKKIIPEAHLLFSDTDSFCLELPGSCPEEPLEKLKHIMDFSNIDPKHPLYSTERKGVVGFFKEEMNLSREIQECALIRAKCYSLKTSDRKNTEETESYNKCKGLRRHRVAKLDFELYKSVIKGDDPKIEYGEQTTLRSFHHSIYTMQTRKRIFGSFDDKKWLLDCGVHSYSYGNYKILEKGSSCDICGVYGIDDPME
jgi:hypothetical protein